MSGIDNTCMEALEINPKDIYLISTETLLKILNNVLDQPKKETFRRIRSSNPNIKSKVLCAVGARQFLLKIGFLEDNDSFVLPSNADLDKLKNYRDALHNRRLSYVRTDGNPIELEPSQQRVVVKSPATPSVTEFQDHSRKKEVKETPNSINKKEKLKRQFPPATGNILNTTNKFLRNVEMYFNTVLQYEDIELQEKALACIPVVTLEIKAQERMRQLQRAIKTGSTKGPEVTIDEMLLLELLEWFKSSFFTWVNTPPCQNCHSSVTFSHIAAEKDYNIEVYKCNTSTCQTMTQFPRFNNPGLLLLTRRGRCGEWANCFTLLCRALGWDARYVVDQGDHVWTEVYSASQGRWLHCDPCENACDTPLMYESGWGKKISYVIAYSAEEVQDVSWRYSSNHKEVMKRRNLCSESDLLSALGVLRTRRQSLLTSYRRQYLLRRVLSELVEMMTPKVASESASQGRTSGSLSWRLARGETSSAVVTSAFVWRPLSSEETNQEVLIRYSAARDIYERVDKQMQVMKTLHKWNQGIFEVKNVFRKVEKDWEMAYLARTEGSALGAVTWQFDVGNNGFVIDSVTTLFDCKMYENGVVNAQLCGEHICVQLRTDGSRQVHTNLEGDTKLYLKVQLSGGRGDVAWQHAQLFRQNLNDLSYPLEIKIKLKKL